LKCKKNVSKCKKSCFFILVLFSLVFSLVPLQNAFSIPPVWPGTFTLNDGGVQGTGSFSALVTVSVTDAAATGSGTITVLITSSVDPVGFDLTLNEGPPGTFTNTNLALMHDNVIATMSSEVIITIFDDTDTLSPTLPGGPVFIYSDSDSTVGLTPTFTQTGPGSSLYKATINFGAATIPATNTLEAVLGDIFTVFDIGADNWANGFIGPNPNLGKGAIQAEVSGIVTATYQGDSSSFIVGLNPGPGRGSGGLVNPGLVVDNPSSGGEGNGCSGDCQPPTLGLDQKFKRIVSKGFSYNNNPVDVEFYYTSYPLITATIGQENVVELKIFEGQGVQNIGHVGFAFGLGKDQFFSDSKAVINLDITRDGIEKTSVYDPENVLDNVRIVTSKKPCNDSKGPLCLVVRMHHMFREQLLFNMVSTVVTDHKRNSWQNFYNHGIEIIGDSLNPPKTKLVAFGEKEMRGLYELTQIDKKNHLWVDEFGNFYEDKGNDRFDRIFTAEKIIYDKVTIHGCDRNCNWFYEYKLNQELLAKITLSELLDGKTIENKDLKEAFSHSFNILKRSEDPELQKSIQIEKEKAEKIVKTLLAKKN